MRIFYWRKKWGFCQKLPTKQRKDCAAIPFSCESHIQDQVNELMKTNIGISEYAQVDASSLIRHRFDVEIPHRKFVDSTSKIDEILMSSPGGFFDVVSILNR